MQVDNRGVIETRAKRDVSIEATISGKPVPSVQWFKDGKKLLPDTRINLTDTQRKSILDIRFGYS